jgi:hypothetical protein
VECSVRDQCTKVDERSKVCDTLMDGKAGLNLRLIKCRVGSLIQGCADATNMAGY